LFLQLGCQLIDLFYETNEDLQRNLIASDTYRFVFLNICMEYKVGGSEVWREESFHTIK
jgi:hypothetical protein